MTLKITAFPPTDLTPEEVKKVTKEKFYLGRLPAPARIPWIHTVNFSTGVVEIAYVPDKPEDKDKEKDDAETEK